MNTEQYLTHPMFGLLFLICPVDEGTGLYSTLYTQQLFFLVSGEVGGPLIFDPVGREQVRRLVEARMRVARSQGNSDELNRLLQFQRRYF